MNVGKIVLYQLTEEDAEAINRRRIDNIRNTNNWPAGAQAHIGNRVMAGDVYPAIIVRDWGDLCNLQVFLDGNDSYWAMSKSEEDKPGSWILREMY